MILDSKARPLMGRPGAARRGDLRRLRVIELETELEKVEREIESVSERAKRLADELGSRYAIFRCGGKKHDEGQSIRETGIMFLSRQTDDCIQSIYSLEQRRRELLHRIGR